jgi:hypothetical protein
VTVLSWRPDRIGILRRSSGQRAAMVSGRIRSVEVIDGELRRARGGRFKMKWVLQEVSRSLALLGMTILPAAPLPRYRIVIMTGA